MIRMLLEGMLADLGHSVAAEAGDLRQALDLARQGQFDLAVLDVNLNGDSVTPVVEILADRKSTRLNSSHSLPSRMPSSA